MNKSIREEDHSLWEVVLRQPWNHTLLLHIWTASNIDNQISQVLPMSDNINSPSSDFGITSHNWNTCCKWTINAEHNTFHSSGKHSQIACGTALVPSDHHFDGIHTNSQSLLFGYAVGYPATAVGYLCVKVHPSTRRWLSHYEDINLFTC